MEDIIKNVLIIDDEKSLLFSMKEGFEPYKDKLNILTANDGVEAIVALETNTVDLVVTDLKMPGLDGFQVIAHMSKHTPDVPVIVMTAFNTPEIEAKLKENGALTIFEKPVDFDEFVKTVLEKINNTNNGKLSGISLASFMQLIQSEQKSCLVEVVAGNKQGHIFFNKGELLNSIYDGLKGEEAIYKLLEYKEVKIGLKKPPAKKIARRIKNSLMQVLMEGMKRIDEKDKKLENDEDTKLKNEKEEVPEPLDEEVKNNKPNNKGEPDMSKLNEIMEKFKVIEGLMAAGAFTPQGEKVTEINPANINLGEIGALANDVLLKAQKSTDIMGVGRGQLVHIEAPKAHVLTRCLNESTDYSATTSGRAHVHMVVVLDQEGNLGMAKMRLESIIQEVAEHFR